MLELSAPLAIGIERRPAGRRAAHRVAERITAARCPPGAWSESTGSRPDSPPGARRVHTEPRAKNDVDPPDHERRTALEDGEASQIERPHPPGLSCPGTRGDSGRCFLVRPGATLRLGTRSGVEGRLSLRQVAASGAVSVQDGGRLRETRRRWPVSARRPSTSTTTRSRLAFPCRPRRRRTAARCGLAARPQGAAPSRASHADAAVTRVQGDAPRRRLRRRRIRRHHDEPAVVCAWVSASGGCWSPEVPIRRQRPKARCASSRPSKRNAPRPCESAHHSARWSTPGPRRPTHRGHRAR